MPTPYSTLKAAPKRKPALIIAVAAICILLGISLTSCVETSAAAKVDGAVLITQAAQTVEAQLAQTATAELSAQPSATPTVTASPTPTVMVSAAAFLGATATQPPTQPAAKINAVAAYSACDVAGFVSDVTISDGTVIDGGSSFTKTWKLINNGTCTWTSSYNLVFYSGTQMDGPSSQQLTSTNVAPGGTLEISVDLTAPASTGTYYGYWALQNASGKTFGIGSASSPFYVNIVVNSAATATPTATSTSEYTATPTESAATATATAATATVAPTSATEPTATATTAPTVTPAPTETPVPPIATPAPTETAATGG